MLEKNVSSIKELKQSIGKLSSNFVKEIAIEASKDLEQEHNKIVKLYYDGYEPNRWDRSYGLYNTIVYNKVINTSRQHWKAEIYIDSNNMDNYYNTPPENVFDLMWNENIRGLPLASKKKDWKNEYYMEFKPNPHKAMQEFVQTWGDNKSDTAIKSAIKRI